MMDQGQPNAVQIMQQLVQIRQDHPDAYPAALKHTLDLFGGDVKNFLTAFQSETQQGGQQDQAQPSPPQPQMPTPPARPIPQQAQPQPQRAPTPPPVKPPAMPQSAYGMSQGPRFQNGPTTPDKIASGLMSGQNLNQARSLAGKPAGMAEGGFIYTSKSKLQKSAANSNSITPDFEAFPTEGETGPASSFDPIEQSLKSGYSTTDYTIDKLGKANLNKSGFEPDRDLPYSRDSRLYREHYIGPEDLATSNSYKAPVVNIHKPQEKDFAVGGFLNPGGGLRRRPFERNFADGGQQEPPPGSTPEEVADNIQINVSQDETVIPADVSKWFGQHTFEQMREEAKAGFAKMAQEGRLKSGGGNADGGMQDYTSTIEGSELLNDKHKLETPDRDTGRDTGFMAGGQVLPNASPVDGFADGGFVDKTKMDHSKYIDDPPYSRVDPNDPDAAYKRTMERLNAGMQSKHDMNMPPAEAHKEKENSWFTNPLKTLYNGFADGGLPQDPQDVHGGDLDTNKDVTNSGTRTDPNTWGGPSDPHASAYNFAEKALNVAMGAMAPGIAGSLAGPAIGTISGMVDTNRLAQTNPEIGAPPSGWSIAAHELNPFSTLTNWAGLTTNPVDSYRQEAEKATAMRPDPLQDEKDKMNQVGDYGAEATSATNPDVESRNREDQAVGQSNRDEATKDTVAADSGDRENGREGFGGGSGHETADTGEHGTESAGGDGGGSGNAATGGFITKSKHKRIDPDNMLKAQHKGFMVGGFVEPRASVRKITSRGIRVPKIL